MCSLPLSLFFFVLAVCAGVILWCCLMLYRNDLVYKYRMRVLTDPDKTTEEHLKNHDALPEYEAMMYQFTRTNWDDYVGYTPAPFDPDNQP